MFKLRKEKMEKI